MILHCENASRTCPYFGKTPALNRGDFIHPLKIITPVDSKIIKKTEAERKLLPGLSTGDLI